MAPISRRLSALVAFGMVLVSGPAGLAQGPTECPFLKKASPTPAAPINPAVLIDQSPLANLEKLRRAERLLAEAEALAGAGDLAAACRKWNEVQQLCPGSRHAAAAREKVTLARISRKPSEGEESAAPPKPAAEAARLSLGICVDFRVSAGCPSCGRVVIALEDKRLGLTVCSGPKVKVELSGWPVCPCADCLGSWLRILSGSAPAKSPGAPK